MTDRSKAGATRTDAARATPAPEPEPISGPRLWPRVVGVLILLVGVGGAWIWQNPGFVQNSLRTVFPGTAGHDTEAARLQALEARVGRLEQRSAPTDLTSVAQRLDALEQRVSGLQSSRQAGQAAVEPGQPAGLAAAQPGDLRPLLARLDALEARVATTAPTTPGQSVASASTTQTAAPTAPPTLVPVGPDLQPLLARLDALERQSARPTADPAKVDALAAQVKALEAHDAGADVRGKLDDVEHRLGELTAGETKLADATGHTERLARLDAAAIALAAGRPLGAIPDAPPALARFATASPPTEAGLRLAFAAASQAALRVSRPDTEGKPFLDRILARLQDFRLITVREGDHVVIGNSDAAALARARVSLDAGDLDGAVRTVATLTGPPAEKMAPWLADAKALQAAREALASLTEAG